MDAAAFELFRERGFEQTTVADIAARAGLDKRTFYRLFGDKREVLFGGSGHLEEVLVKAVAETDAAPSRRSSPPSGGWRRRSSPTASSWSGAPVHHREQPRAAGA
ncbi:helix-turn-helix domain-containing protein [Micromonospora sp. M12]